MPEEAEETADAEEREKEEKASPTLTTIVSPPSPDGSVNANKIPVQKLPFRAENCMTDNFRLTLIWICGSVLAFLCASLALSASYVDGHFIPVGNDCSDREGKFESDRYVDQNTDNRYSQREKRRSRQLRSHDRPGTPTRRHQI